MDTSRSNAEIVTVSEYGQTVIPKRFRESLGIEIPGRVLFRERNDGAVVIERVRTASEMQGFASSHDGTDEPASHMLQEKREHDRESMESTVDE